MDYQKEIENIVKSEQLKKEEVHDYRGLPNEDIIKSYYEFCRGNLDLFSEQALNIKPNVFVFTGFFGVNARATKTENGYFIILIYKGLLKLCYDNFFINNKLNEYFEKSYPQIIKAFDNPLSYIGYQITTCFTYYHELAHLVQFEKLECSSLSQEKSDSNSKYSLDNHKLEINADAFASRRISLHIQEYIEIRFIENINKKVVSDTIQIICCCLMYYICSFYPKLEQLYIKEHLHPHPIIRLFNILLNITNLFNKSPFLLKRNIKIDPISAIDDVFDLYIDLEKQGVFNSNFSEALDNAILRLDEIKKYTKELTDFDVQKYHNSLDFL